MARVSANVGSETKTSAAASLVSEPRILSDSRKNSMVLPHWANCTMFALDCGRSILAVGGALVAGWTFCCVGAGEVLGLVSGEIFAGVLVLAFPKSRSKRRIIPPSSQAAGSHA